MVAHRSGDGAAPAVSAPHPPALREPISRAILVFVRAPVIGRVKTRLAAELGPAAALRVYRRLAEHAVAEALALAGEGVEVRVHFTPSDAREEVEAWLGDGPVYLAQAPSPELGERMRTAFGDAFAAGHDRVLIIGSDLPEVSRDALGRALRLLDAHEAVIGPAADGGYWLLGLRAPVPGVFEGIAWSTDEVFARTMERLRAAGIEPARMEALRDVDTAADLPAGWREWTVEG
ncbi:MAG TPA: TIGR04282 family arsenosugar biosynthesis glycosyltransferase [Longimicrobium sp.]|nr:TIGR04282 family arsenosugar biosynthesis glycosyltransferase [Longimicrobium sp.]